jgi:hypothetical protein
MSRENPWEYPGKLRLFTYIQIQGLNISAEDAKMYSFSFKFILNAKIELRR